MVVLEMAPQGQIFICTKFDIILSGDVNLLSLSQLLNFSNT